MRKAGHLMVVALLFLSTTGMTVSLHYCNHQLYDIGVFSRAESCCMPHADNSQKRSHDRCTTAMQQQGHCEDEILTVKHVDDFLASTFRTDLNIQSVPDLPFPSANPQGLHFMAASHTIIIPVHPHAPPGITIEASFLQTFLI